MYPPIQYNPEISTEDFVRAMAHNAGQLSVIDKLKQVLEIQEKKWGQM